MKDEWGGASLLNGRRADDIMTRNVVKEKRRKSKWLPTISSEAILIVAVNQRGVWGRAFINRCCLACRMPRRDRKRTFCHRVVRADRRRMSRCHAHRTLPKCHAPRLPPSRGVAKRSAMSRLVPDALMPDAMTMKTTGAPGRSHDAGRDWSRAANRPAPARKRVRKIPKWLTRYAANFRCRARPRVDRARRTKSRGLSCRRGPCVRCDGCNLRRYRAGRS